MASVAVGDAARAVPNAAPPPAQVAIGHRSAVVAEERILRIRRRLLRWGRANYISYAWRTEIDPWLSLVAELLLQRTRAAQVEPVCRELARNYPTAASLAAG